MEGSNDYIIDNNVTRVVILDVRIYLCVALLSDCTDSLMGLWFGFDKAWYS